MSDIALSVLGSVWTDVAGLATASVALFAAGLTAIRWILTPHVEAVIDARVNGKIDKLTELFETHRNEVAERDKEWQEHKLEVHKHLAVSTDRHRTITTMLSANTEASAANTAKIAALTARTEALLR
jgi:hypothetical protein